MRAYVLDLQRFIISGATAGAAERVPPFSSCFVTACRHAGFITGEGVFIPGAPKRQDKHNGEIRAVTDPFHPFRGYLK